MRILPYIMIIASMALISSCGDSFTQTIEIDEPEFDRKMVLFTRSSPGDTLVEFVVGRNVGILESGPETNYFLSDASMKILNLDTDDSYDFEESGFFVGNGLYSIANIEESFFKEGSTYEYTLRHPDYSESITEVKMPRAGALSNIVYKYEDGLDEEGDDASSINFDFIENAEEGNFYELELLRYRDEGDIMPTSLWIYTIEPAAIKAIPNDNLFFSDESFNGESKRIEIKFDRWLYNPASGRESIELRLYSINKGYYDYVKSLDRFQNTMDTPFASPVQVSSNVDQALGTIGLRVLQSYRIIP